MDSVSSLLIKMRPKLSWRNLTKLAHILWTNFRFSLHLPTGSFRCKSISAAMFCTPGRYSSPLQEPLSLLLGMNESTLPGNSRHGIVHLNKDMPPFQMPPLTTQPPISQWEGMEPRGTPLTDKLSFSEGICLRPWLSYFGVSKSWSPNHWPMLAKFVVRGVPEVCQPCDPPNSWNNEVVVYPSRRCRESQSQSQE